MRLPDGDLARIPHRLCGIVDHFSKILKNQKVKLLDFVFYAIMYPE